MKYIYTIFLTSFLLFIYTSCEEAGNPRVADQRENQISLLLDNTIDFGIVPIITELEISSAQLLSQIEAIENNNGAIDLSDLRAAWLQS
ncbi:MAG: hypothetical protein AAF696_26365, partial [Bacteroidota bacterium]